MWVTLEIGLSNRDFSGLPCPSTVPSECVETLAGIVTWSKAQTASGGVRCDELRGHPVVFAESDIAVQAPAVAAG